ncbi:uncharacterized protein Gasu_45690 [Galdieria sulphuraria]|uniref:Uncharacterized protein n=1 Tax=Galdieria sulphuraria TaxID=130081 RepID=M2XD88_GALSU|nr:uncharacterized protein Gasu_45690 [Galdieria sulphuraria]EME27907.1 hypothetical protein Gasu_45690 [Galdieria sulphuraria]|eukprot:XP_005704427.1 hypothetical protein Gasu_45690 [Galdieria sulphuraria]
MGPRYETERFRTLLSFTSSSVELKCFRSKPIYGCHKSTILGTKLVAQRCCSVASWRRRNAANTPVSEKEIRWVLHANLSFPKKKTKNPLSGAFTLLGVSCVFLLGRPTQAAIWKGQGARSLEQHTAFVETKSDTAFDEKFLRNEKITEVPAADYLESCVDRDFQYSFSWSRTYELYTLFGSLAFVVVFNTFAAFVDNFIQQQERKEVQEEMERFGRFLSPKTEYRDDVSLEKVDINMWKAQQRERSFYGREFSAQDMFEDNNNHDGEEEEDNDGDEKNKDDGDVDYKGLEKLLKK